MSAPVSQFLLAHSELSISVLEQPVTHHRFRYESEAPGNRLGGLLYGRSGSKNSCVRIRVAGLDPSRQREILLIGGTFSPELYPHPYFMVGDNCDGSGLFSFRRVVTTSEMTISLEKVSLICAGKMGQKLAAAVEKRNEVGFNPFNKNPKDVKYTSRNLNRVRLAFELYYIDETGTTQKSSAAAVYTDVIEDIKLLVKLGIDSLLPNTGSMCGGQELWIYFRDPLPHEDKAQYQVSMCVKGSESGFIVPIDKIKKHLFVIFTPNFRTCIADSPYDNSERLHIVLTVADLRSGVDSSHDLILTDSCERCGNRFLRSDDELSSKRKRALNSVEADALDAGVAAPAINCLPPLDYSEVYSFLDNAQQ